MMRARTISALAPLLLIAGSAWAQTPPAVPDRRIPPSVLAELRALEDRFEAALAQDCAPERCFPKGCTYGEHAVADQPRQTALPGLAEKQGPGAGPSQEYLTLARCTFAYEKDLSNKDASALVRRLRTKLSSGWTRVQVSRQRLPEISPELREAPTPPEPPEPEVVEEEAIEPPPPPAPEVFEPTVALRELWLSLLPHFSWMIAILMVTLAALLLIWGWRRLGRLSPEEQLLLSQMGPAEPEPTDAEPEPEVAPEPEEDDFVETQRAYWSERLQVGAEPDPDVRALVSRWLKAEEMDLLAKAVLTYPEALPAAFPDGGQYAEAKLRFSEHLRDVEPEALPSDEAFYAQLKQHALSAALARHDDASAVQTLRADFGAAGLVRVIEALPPRHGALLYAHASTSDQLEAARVLSSAQLADLCEQLLSSNRMSRSESGYLLELLEASREDQPLPDPPRRGEVSDLGTTFDAAAALSILLPRVEGAERANLLAHAKARFGGAFPSWYRDILFAEVVLALPAEARADLMLEVDVQSLAGWLSLIPSASKDALLQGMSGALHGAVQASSAFPSPAVQLERYGQGRLEVAEALQRQLARLQLPLEQVMV